MTSPEGDTYLGNQFERGRSASGGSPDDVNNVEVVMLPAPVPGRWTITVEAARVAEEIPGRDTRSRSRLPPDAGATG